MSAEKIKQINLLDPKPYVDPQETAHDNTEEEEEERSETDSEVPDLSASLVKKSPKSNENQINLFDQ